MISSIMFVCCSQPRVLHVTLTNSTIGFQLNLWSLQCQQLTIVLIVLFFIIIFFLLPQRADKTQPGQKSYLSRRCCLYQTSELSI